MVLLDCLLVACSFLIRHRKRREPDVRETGEELGGVEGGVTVIKIYLLNKEKIKKCLDNYIHFLD